MRFDVRRVGFGAPGRVTASPACAPPDVAAKCALHLRRHGARGRIGRALSWPIRITGRVVSHALQSALRVQQPAQSLQGRRRGRRHRPRRARRRVLRPARAERRRQDDDDRDLRRPDRAGLGRREGAGPPLEPDEPALRQRLGIQLQDTQLADKLTRRRNPDAVSQLLSAGADRATRSSTLVQLGEKRRRASARCRAARSSDWRSRARSSAIPSCSFSTSRPRASIRRRAASSGTSSPISRARAGRFC